MAGAASAGHRMRGPPNRSTPPTPNWLNEESGVHGAKFFRDSRSGAPRSTQQSKQGRNLPESTVNSRGNSKPNGHSKRNSSIRNDRRDVGASKSTQRRFSRTVELTAAQTPTVVPLDKAVVRQVADGSNGAAEVITDQQEGIVVNHESGGFKTVKSRRTVISEKKKSRQRLVSSETIVSRTEENKPAHAFVAKNTGEQAKGGQVQETFKPVVVTSVLRSFQLVPVAAH
ncbi:hypothetical protein DVH05_004339 [Phytophthora capsici]|nr:hypothetical protein DVH05_004339 [Phytophthora capsici]